MVDHTNKEFNEIKKLISSQPYEELAKSIILRANKILCEDVYDVEISHCQELSGASGFSIDDVKNLVVSKDVNFQKFCLSYIAAEAKLDLGQEYNPAEPPEEEASSNEIYVGHSKVFLFENSVYFLILRDKPEQLAGFLKTMRVPHAAKYAKVLTKFFSNFR